MFGPFVVNADHVSNYNLLNIVLLPSFFILQAIGRESKPGLPHAFISICETESKKGITSFLVASICRRPNVFLESLFLGPPWIEQGCPNFLSI